MGAIGWLSTRAPSVVVGTLCASLLAFWFGVPDWVPTILAIAIGLMALALFATRVRRHEARGVDEFGDAKERSWLDYELAGKGTPPGYYVLAFFGFLTIVLTGFDSAYSRPAWAAFALGLVWGLANRSYAADDEAEG